MKSLTWLVLAVAADALAAAPTMTLQPFNLKLPHALTAAQAKAEFVRPRDLRAGAEAPTNLPRNAPTNCAQLIQRWDEWSGQGLTDKWMEIAYDRAMLDCLTLKHLASVKPAARTVEQVVAAMSTGTQLSGDFYPGVWHAASDYTLTVRPAAKDVPSSLQLSLKNGEPGRTFRTYYVMAGSAGADGEEWYAVEQVESGTGTFADCAFVVIAPGFDNPYSVRERIHLGRCG